MTLNTNFPEFPVLSTDHLILREVFDTDAEEMLYLRSDKEVMKYIPRPLAQTIQDALDRISMFREAREKEEGIHWTITQKGNDKLIGVISIFKIDKESFRAEIGYMLHPDNQGKGIISEALKEIIQFGFEKINLHSLNAIIDPRNTASEKVLQKANFKKEAHFREDFYFDGEFLDSVHYSILNPQH